MRSTYRGVVTTGIYCRAGCPATPLERNTRPFEFAAAAEVSGFRPCLRCRPDDLPGPASWVAPSEVVCRALRLIADGALDGCNEDTLAARLGVSARHLRRLFAEQVGASPDAVARSRRAHLARRLLDETDLGVAQIAFASGFASVRQMNRVMRDTFRHAPTELRAKRRRANRPAADGGLQLRLPFRPPLQWETLASYLHARATAGVESVSPDAYRRLLRVDGHPAVVEAYAPAEPEHLRVRLHLPAYDGLSHVVSGIRRALDLDTDPAAVTETLGRDPLLRRLLAKGGAPRLAGAFDPFETGVRAILGQQISVRAATTLAGRIVSRYGTPVPGLGGMGLSALFPAPDTLAAAGLEEVGLPVRRAGTIRAFSRAVASGAVPLDRGAGLERTLEGLMAIPGVGSWTAHYIAMRCCGERDAFPAADLGLLRATGASSARALEALAERWRPWRAYAAMLLWTASS